MAEPTPEILEEMADWFEAEEQKSPWRVHITPYFIRRPATLLRSIARDFRTYTTQKDYKKTEES